MPNRKPTRSLKATGMLVLLTVIWGGTFPATKAALDVTDPMQFIAMRFGIAVLLTAPFLHKLRKIGQSSIPIAERTGFLSSKLWIAGAWVGLWLFIGYALQASGMKFTTASRSGFFTGLLVVITPFVAHLFRTSRTPWLSLIAAPISLAGVWLMADPELGGLNTGDWLTIACALAFAIQMVTLEAVANKTGDPWGLTFVQMVTLGGLALVWSIAEGNPLVITKAGWFGLAYTGLFGSIFAVWLQTRYQPETTAGHAALIFTLEPVFAAVFASMLLGETWTSRGLIGAGVVLTAMLWSSFVLSRQPKD